VRGLVNSGVYTTYTTTTLKTIILKQSECTESYIFTNIDSAPAVKIK